MTDLLGSSLIFLVGLFAGMGWGYAAGMRSEHPRR